MATQGMWDSIKRMFTKAFDFDGDGDFDFADISVAFKKVVVFMLPVIQSTAKAAETALMPALVAGIKYVIANNIPGGREDKERAALQASIEDLKTNGVLIGVDAALATSEQMLDALADHFGMSTTELDAVWKNTVLQQTGK